jgi:hypothetical protein
MNLRDKSLAVGGFVQPGKKQRRKPREIHLIPFDSPVVWVRPTIAASILNSATFSSM